MAPRRSKTALARLVPLTLIARPQQCVAYGRVSSDKQREDQTITTQQTLLGAEVTSRDRPDLPEADQRKLVAEFWDDGVSGTIPLEQREQGRNMVRLICNRADIQCRGECATSAVVDSVWITKLDRLARNLQILIHVEAFFRTHGVALRSLEFSIDTSTPTGKMIFQLLGTIAEWEREIILQRTRQGRRQKASEGRFVGGRRTFGLKTDDNGHLVVDETLLEGVNRMACDIVKEIFDNVALHGSSAWREAQRFNMTERRVQGILHNPRYKGEGGMLADGEWVSATKNQPPQIVSPEVWDLAQTALLDNRRRSSRNRQYTYLLSQVMVCCEPWSHLPVFDADGVKIGRNPKMAGICGRIYQGRIENRHNKGGGIDSGYETRYTYYFCTRQGCTGKPLRGGDVEDAVWKLVSEAQRHPEQFLEEAIQRRDNDQAIGELRAEVTAIIDHLSRLETERLNVLRSWEKGRRTDDETDTRLAEIADEVGPLQDHRVALESQLRSLTLSATDMRRAGITLADIGEQLDRIDAQSRSDNPEEVRKGRERKMAIIKASLDRIEVRTGPSRESILQVYLKFSPRLSLDLAVGNRQKFVVEPRISSNPYDNEQQSVTVVRQIVIPRPPMGPPPGSKSVAA